MAIGNLTTVLNTEQDNKYEWTFYVKEAEGEEKLSKLAERVEVNLHPTFRPPVIRFNKIPEEGIKVARIGWGTFNIRAKIVWKKELGGGFSELEH